MENHDNFSIVITAYGQLDLVKKNIERIRNEYKILNNTEVIVVTTLEDPTEFYKLEDQYGGVYVIGIPNAPGSANSNWFRSPENPGGYISWRHQFIAPRILFSLERGAKLALDLGKDKILHIHSDTYWHPDKEDTLVGFINKLDEVTIVADTSAEDELSSQQNSVLPPMMHLHPEGMLINIRKCSEMKYGKYILDAHRIFDQSSTSFRSHNYGSPEALLAQYLIFSLTGKNILKVDDQLPPVYFQEVLFTMCRGYHGVFSTGLINERIIQPDAK